MTITIAANAVAGTATAGGVSYDTFIEGFISGLSGFPTFNSGASFSGDEIEMIYGNPPAADTKAFIANGPTIGYNFATHTVFGTINQMSLGVMGDSSSIDADGHLIGTDVQLAISGLDITNDASDGVGDFRVQLLGGVAVAVGDLLL